MNKPLPTPFRRTKLQKQREKPAAQTGYDKSAIDAPPIHYKPAGDKI